MTNENLTTSINSHALMITLRTFEAKYVHETKTNIRVAERIFFWKLQVFIYQKKNKK